MNISMAFKVYSGYLLSNIGSKHHVIKKDKLLKFLIVIKHYLDFFKRE